MAQTAVSLNDLIVTSHRTALGGEMDRRADIASVVALPEACIRWAMLERNDYQIGLFKYYTLRGERHGRRQSDRGFTHIALEVSDEDEVYRRVMALGLCTTCPPKVARRHDRGDLSHRPGG